LTPLSPQRRFIGTANAPAAGSTLPVVDSIFKTWIGFLSPARARTAGLDPEWFLAQNDSHHFFIRIGDLFVTGPAQTHVMDLRILLIAPVFEMD
jgi:hypothetical protein